MIHITVEDQEGVQRGIEIPEGINLSLMEVLKASEYNVLATCGGMALCATCHVEVLEGGKHLPPLNDSELDLLDTLPDATSGSRLACQIRITEAIEGTVFRLKAAEEE